MIARNCPGRCGRLLFCGSGQGNGRHRAVGGAHGDDGVVILQADAHLDRAGFAAQNDRRLHFGLGKSDAVERVEIRWPSGKTQSLTAPELNKLHKIKEVS